MALVDKSGLAHYCGASFVPCKDEEAFEKYWRTTFHPEFGRYMAWVFLTVGAENLAKAACVCNEKVKANSKKTLDNYLKEHFKELCEKSAISETQLHSLLCKYTEIKKLRDRDAHSFRQNKRKANFPLVADTFLPAFHILTEAMKKAGHPQQ